MNRALLLAWSMGVAACTERSTPQTGGEDAGSSSSSAQSSESSGPIGSEGVADAGEASSSGGAALLPYPDCRQSFTGGIRDCSGAWGGGDPNEWRDFACEVCLCSDSCMSHDDCFDPGARAVPQCVPLSAEPQYKACFLVCERDEDCPPEMVCITAGASDVQACHWTWAKPQCCNEGGSC